MLEYAISIKYMLAGYAVILIVLAVYVISLFIRWRNLEQDLHLLEDIRKNDK
jgi:hypothetical protein